MNEIANIQSFAVGAVTLAASRDAAIRAEVLRVGDAVRILTKPSYGEPKVCTGVIVAFEPFKDLPTIVIAYIEADFSKAELKMLYFNDKATSFEVLRAAPDCALDIEKSRVLDWFDSEEKRALASVDDVRAKRRYFEKYFGAVMSEITAEAA